VQNVSTSVQAVGSGSASVSLLSTPVPGSNDLPASASGAFTWIFQVSGCGQVAFTAWATGYDTGSSAVTSSTPGTSTQATSACTPTPSPTVSPTATATPSPTPWIVYATPTPLPSMGDASIPGNLFRPEKGQALQLNFSVPLEGTVQIDIYSRLGQLLKHFELSVMPGAYTQLWDGRDNQGALLPSGIYVAQFKGKGLFKTVKLAVLK
jgi:hypothetical protein